MDCPTCWSPFPNHVGDILPVSGPLRENPVAHIMRCVVCSRQFTLDPRGAVWEADPLPADFSSPFREVYFTRLKKTEIHLS